MNRAVKMVIVSVSAGLAFAAWFFTRPITVVTGESELWSSEFDAYRRGSFFPGAGTPKERLRRGERLRVLWTAQGKDYQAALVIRQNWERGWVQLWQQGIASARS